MSNVVLWLDYCHIAQRLLSAAIENGDAEATVELNKVLSKYNEAAYEACRMRVDEISMGVLNRPSADLYTKTQRLKLEGQNMRVSGIRFLQKSNAAMLTAKAKAVATQRAGVGSGPTQGEVDDKSKNRGVAHQGIPSNKKTKNKSTHPVGEPLAAAGGKAVKMTESTTAVGKQ